MLEALALRGTERVLEVGTGSGYAAALLSRLARQVVSIERRGNLADRATERLAHLGCTNVRVVHADGTLGWPRRAPYEAIAVAAGGPVIPEALRQQLAVGGRLVIPVGSEEDQVLMLLTRTGPDTFVSDPIADVRFVPLVGAQGWRPPGDAVPTLVDPFAGGDP